MSEWAGLGTSKNFIVPKVQAPHEMHKTCKQNFVYHVQFLRYNCLFTFLGEIQNSCQRSEKGLNFIKSAPIICYCTIIQEWKNSEVFSILRIRTTLNYGITDLKISSSSLLCVRLTASCSRVSNGLDFVHQYHGLQNGFLWIHKEWRNIPILIKALLAYVCIHTSSNLIIANVNMK